MCIKGTCNRTKLTREISDKVLPIDLHFLSELTFISNTTADLRKITNKLTIQVITTTKNSNYPSAKIENIIMLA